MTGLKKKKKKLKKSGCPSNYFTIFILLGSYLYVYIAITMSLKLSCALKRRFLLEYRLIHSFNRLINILTLYITKRTHHFVNIIFKWHLSSINCIIAHFHRLSQSQFMIIAMPVLRVGISIDILFVYFNPKNKRLWIKRAIIE